MYASRFVLIIACLAVLGGCASMSKKECLSANWQYQGELDGRSGLPLSTIDRHAKACAKVSVAPDEMQYVDGRERGLLYYCTADVGLAEGRRNREYQDVCPAESEPAFLESYIDGLELKLVEIDQQSNIANSSLSRLRMEQAASGGKADKKLAASISAQESTITSNSSDQLTIRTRIARLRLKLNR